MSNRKTIAERIVAAQHEKAQAEARIKELLQQQKTQERKDRTHRLCKRGGLVEKLLPELAALTDEQFEVFADKCLLTTFVRRILAEIAAGDTAQTPRTAPHNSTAQSAKPVPPKAESVA